MFKTTGLLLLLHAVASARGTGPIPMPEASALPDLIICLAAVGCMAWYQHRKSNRRRVSHADHV
jgi:hypothetical protein